MERALRGVCCDLLGWLVPLWKPLHQLLGQVEHLGICSLISSRVCLQSSYFLFLVITVSGGVHTSGIGIPTWGGSVTMARGYPHSPWHSLQRQVTQELAGYISSPKVILPGLTALARFGQLILFRVGLVYQRYAYLFLLSYLLVSSFSQL